MSKSNWWSQETNWVLFIFIILTIVFIFWWFIILDDKRTQDTLNHCKSLGGTYLYNYHWQTLCIKGELLEYIPVVGETLKKL